jgi:hypothetical protein
MPSWKTKNLNNLIPEKSFVLLRNTLNNEASIGLLMLSGAVPRELKELAIVGVNESERQEYLNYLINAFEDIKSEISDIITSSLSSKSRRTIMLSNFYVTLVNLNKMQSEVEESIPLARVGLVPGYHSSLVNFTLIYSIDKNISTTVNNEIFHCTLLRG